MATILLNTVTIAMETTSLSTTHSLLFVATDNIFLGIYILEFILKVQPCSKLGMPSNKRVILFSRYS